MQPDKDPGIGVMWFGMYRDVYSKARSQWVEGPVDLSAGSTRGLKNYYSDELNVQEEFEETEGVIRIFNLKKDRQQYGQKKRGKRTNNDLQNITHKRKDRVTRNPLKTGCEILCSGGVSSSCSTSDTRHFTLVTNTC